LRVTDLVTEAAATWPGIVADRAHLESQRRVLLREKDGSDRAVGALLSAILGDPLNGSHLIASMLSATPGALETTRHFRRRGSVDLGAAAVRRDGSIGTVVLQNPRYLNAEDTETLSALETAVDLAFLDAEIDVVLLRGGVIPSGAYAGQRVFGSGLNLTALYNGSLSSEFFIERELGFVHKLIRGVVDPESGETHSKPVIAVVDNFAIGGACQLLLAVDFVVADREAYFSLPASTEGLIPGASNLRLASHVGVRTATRMLLQGERIEADSSVGALLCDRCVSRTSVETAVSELVGTLSVLDPTATRMNRRAFAYSRESLDDFREYMAFYSSGQAECLASPDLHSRLADTWVDGRTERAKSKRVAAAESVAIDA
jgi:thioesterase DpgC